MTERSFRPPVLTYFQPQDHRDAGRVAEARRQGRGRIPSEMELVRQSTPLYDGHNHPISTIGGGITEWVDSDPSAIARQSELAQEALIDGWIVTAHAGLIRGRKTTELERPLEVIAERKGDGLKFALMYCLSLPRVNLPVELSSPSSRHNERHFDFTWGTFQALVDRAAIHWDNPRYVEVMGRPLLMIYGLRPNELSQILQERPNIIGDICQYSKSIYKVRPYLAACAFDVEGAQALFEAGFETVMTYSYLPTFNPANHDISRLHQDPPLDLQSYKVEFEKRKGEWEKIYQIGRDNGGIFIPSAVVGWDASSRGKPGYRLEEVTGKFPWTPIITDSAPEKLGQALGDLYQYVSRYPPEMQLLVIFAMNELGNGASLLPRVQADGGEDRSYIQILREKITSILDRACLSE